MARTPLILVAASGLAREALGAIQAAGLYEPIGFLDDDPRLAGTKLSGVNVLGGIESVVDHPRAAVLVCAGHGRVRRRMVSRLAELGVDPDRYAVVVHPRAVVAEGMRPAGGSVVLAGAVLTADVVLGDHCVVMPNAVLTHDDVVEDYVTVCAGVTVAGSVTIGEGAYLGASASVRQNLRVGTWSTLGMAAALLADLPDGQTWVGVPAAPLGLLPSCIHQTNSTLERA